MSKRNPAQIYQMGVGAVIVAALLAYFFVISPQLASRADAKEAAETTMQTAELVEGRLAVLQKRVDDSDEAMARINDLTKAFPTTYKQDEFIALLDSAAQSAGVTIVSINTTQPADPSKFTDGQLSDKGTKAAAEGKPSSGKEAPAGAVAATGEGVANNVPREGDTAAGQQIGDFPLAQVSVTMNVEGSTSGMTRFIRSLGGLSRPILIDSLSFSNGDNGSTADLSGRTYLSRPLEVPDFD
ncbi:hypothetical protein [Aeromicrobium sp. 179-A 4D2 NHS]|uniref:hypothetical protein n=1 Tax=Aeromicrobium sp. 179-A 4D2 NHS TaxID=3142375 RepID=UPI0039A26D4F